MNLPKTSVDLQTTPFPIRVIDTLIRGFKFTLSLGLGFGILMAAIFLPSLLDESPQSAETQSGPAYDPIYDINLSADAESLLLRTRRDVLVRDPQTGALLARLPQIDGQASVAVWLPVSRRMIVGSKDGDLAIVSEDMMETQPLSRKIRQKGIRSVIVSKDETRAVTGNAKQIGLWDLGRVQQITQVSMNRVVPNSLQFSADESEILAACNDGSIRIYALPDLTLVRQFQVSKSAIVKAAFIEHGSKILAGNIAGELSVLESTTGNVAHRFSPCDLQLHDLTVSPDEQIFAVTDWSNDVYLYDIKTYRKIATLKGHSKPVTSVAFSPKNNWLHSAGYEGEVKTWDLETHQELSSFPGSLPPLE